MNTYEIMNRIQKGTQDYFYANNKRLSFSNRYGWVIKYFYDNKKYIYSIDSHEAERLIDLSFTDLPIHENVIQAIV